VPAGRGEHPAERDALALDQERPFHARLAAASRAGAVGDRLIQHIQPLRQVADRTVQPDRKIWTSLSKMIRSAIRGLSQLSG
jgi:hypothetical protein